jgi:hypothetical protein
VYADAHLQAERQCNAAVTLSHPVWWIGNLQSKELRQVATNLMHSPAARNTADMAMAAAPRHVHDEQPKRPAVEVMVGEVDTAQEKRARTGEQAVKKSKKPSDGDGAFVALRKTDGLVQVCSRVSVTL